MAHFKVGHFFREIKLMPSNIPRQILLSGLSADGLQNDLINLYTYIDQFTFGLGISKVPIDTQKCSGLIIGINRDFPCKDGIAGASAFKKVANFAAFFSAERPIINPFPPEIIGADLAKIENHQNAMVALNLAVDALHGAQINRSDGEKILVNKIHLSRHSYVDIVDAISESTPQHSFKLLTVLFEQLAYKTNPECQYEQAAIK